MATLFKNIGDVVKVDDLTIERIPDNNNLAVVMAKGIPANQDELPAPYRGKLFNCRIEITHTSLKTISDEQLGKILAQEWKTRQARHAKYLAKKRKLEEAFSHIPTLVIGSEEPRKDIKFFGKYIGLAAAILLVMFSIFSYVNTGTLWFWK